MKRMVLTILAAAVAAALTACGPVHSKDSPPSVRTLMRRAADARGGGDLRGGRRPLRAGRRGEPADRRPPRRSALLVRHAPSIARSRPARPCPRAPRARGAEAGLARLRSSGRRRTLGLALADDLGACENDAEAARAAEAQSGAACAGEKADLAGKLEAAQEELKADRAELKTALADARAARAEAAKLREDNKAKDEALQRVREVLKDWKPKR